VVRKLILLPALRKHVFLNSQNSTTPLHSLSRGHESPVKPMTPSTRLLPPYKSDPSTDSCCYFIDYSTTYPSVHRERLGLTLKNYKITGKIWHLLEENSRSVRVWVLHALIDQNDEVDILRGLPEESRLSPTLFGICVAELILELRAKFPLLQFPQITSIDDLNWIGAFLYV